MGQKKALLEITVKSIILGIVLSIILAAANAYLGLFAGMTVSASIPAAVISMGVLRLFRKSSILENNIVQTAASAGESLAAGVIFTIPALVLMGYWTDFDYIAIAEMAAVGGIIGVMFTIPLRRALIIEAKLTYPEGVATAEVLKAGDEAKGSKEGGKHLMMILKAGLVGGVFKLFQQGFSMWHQAAEGAFGFNNARGGKTIFGFGGDLSPALLGVGYIIGLNISILMIAGGLISWMIVLPIYTSVTTHAGPITMDLALEVWSTQIRYLGVGAMVVGGLWSIVKLFRPLVNGIKTSLEAHRKADNGVEMARTEQDISIKWVIGIVAVSSIPLFLLYLDVLKSVPVTLIMTAVMLVFGFLFSAVAGYMGGLVGSSNNPISGVTIATILFSSLLLLLLLGQGSPEGAAGAIIIGAVVCCAASIAGDNLQDLKAGYLLGATPWKQQIMQIVGTLAAALTLGITLDILHTAYVIGSETLPAPQATLMMSVAQGVFHGGLPWDMIAIGAVLGISIIVVDIILEKRGSSFRMPVLAVAVGLYLPISLSVPVFIGGLISYFTKERRKNDSKKGLLFASGLITGEALMGILVAIPIFASANKEWWPHIGGFKWLGIVLFTLIAVWMYLTAKKKENNI
ncbi:MAG: oligopeptide transporter, OPT family [Candidatus Marinimicrobia bacterium]|nr:oligopeptide transporter, OPT family [Candidatus Neomarinimicrobiota bacterium]